MFRDGASFPGFGIVNFLWLWNNFWRWQRQFVWRRHLRDGLWRRFEFEHLFRYWITDNLKMSTIQTIIIFESFFHKKIFRHKNTRIWIIDEPHLQAVFLTKFYTMSIIQILPILWAKKQISTWKVYWSYYSGDFKKNGNNWKLDVFSWVFKWSFYI